MSKVLKNNHAMQEIKDIIENQDDYFSVGDNVEVICDNDGGRGDDHLIGCKGVIMVKNEEHYSEVRLSGKGRKTYLFGDYQLKKI